MLLPATAQARSAAPAVSLKGAVGYLSIPSTALRGRLAAAVYTPPGYVTGSKRYPVVYFLHGLPAGPAAYRTQIGFVGRYLEATGAQAIAVVPQGARLGDRDPEYFDWGTGRNWQTAIESGLPRYIDSHYRTIAGRRGRAIVGISAGGYGAAIIGLRHPEEYSVVEAWSGYFVARNIKGDEALDLGEDSANLAGSAYSVVSALHGVFARLPTFLGFFVGSDDRLFYSPNRTFEGVLRLLAVPHVFQVYPGGHNEAFWSRHAAHWLQLAVQHLAPAR